MLDRFPLGTPIVGEGAERDFIALFGTYLRLKNILTAFADLAGQEILSERDAQDYQSLYLDLYQKNKTVEGEKEYVNDDIVFEIELIRQVEINVDYILMPVAKYHESNCKDKEILVSIRRAVDSSLRLRSKKEMIERFVETINADSHIEDDWKTFVHEQKGLDREVRSRFRGARSRAI